MVCPLLLLRAPGPRAAAWQAPWWPIQCLQRSAPLRVWRQAGWQVMPRAEGWS